MHRALLFLSGSLLLGCATSQSAVVPDTDFQTIVQAPDRLDADRAWDQSRKPAALLAFLGVKPGMVVAELGAGSGYTTELLARAVGWEGVVYGQNPKSILSGFVEKPWADRLARSVNAGVVRLDREFNDPFGPEVKPLDLVVINGAYHDAVGQNVNRAKMNRAVWEALKPGGHFVIIDASAKSGTGFSAVQSLHRIDESVVRNEVEAAGFQLEAEGSFLRQPADARDWNAAPTSVGLRRGLDDRFALKFVKSK